VFFVLGYSRIVVKKESVKSSRKNISKRKKWY
jgi:hypothetical protein